MSANGEGLREGTGLQVAVEHLFQGSALNAVDAKGRLSVPAFIRQIIELRGSGSHVVLSMHPSLTCLVGYDSRYAGTLWEDATRKREKDENEGADPLLAFDREGGMFGRSIAVPYDASGRIILPNRLKKRSRIDDLAMFYGMGGLFTVWNPHLALESGSRHLSEEAEDLLEERGIRP